MPRPRRILLEGGVSRVSNRLARGEEVFAEPDEAERFLALVREAKQRDGFAGKHPDAVSRWARRAAIRRLENPSLAEQHEALDRKIAARVSSASDFEKGTVDNVCPGIDTPLAGVDRDGKIGPGPAFSDMLTVWAMGKGTRPEDRLRAYLQVQKGRQRATGFAMQLGATAALTVMAPEFIAPRLTSLGIRTTVAGLRSQAIVGAMAGFFSATGESRATGALAGATLGLVPSPTANPISNGLAGFLGNSVGQVLSRPKGRFSLGLALQAGAAGGFATIPTGFLGVTMSPATQRTVLTGLNAGIQAAMQHLVNSSWRAQGIDDATAASTVVRCGGSYKFLNDCSQ